MVASLIEEETQVDAERARVAGVIYNRLEIGEALGIDAALCYPLGLPSCTPTAEQLESDSPYNLRRSPDLPPTPISSPGRASLEAALTPSSTTSSSTCGRRRTAATRSARRTRSTTPPSRSATSVATADVALAAVRVTGATRLAAVIGSPVRHSLSPTILNAAFAATGADWVFMALEVAEGDGERAIAAARTLGLGGLSVTMPHKAAAAAAVDRLTPAAEALGAVNCVYWEGTTLWGDSTDGAGLVDALRIDEGIDPAGARFALVGAGGAGLSVARALGAAGAASVVVVNRTPGPAALAAELAGTAARRHVRGRGRGRHRRQRDPLGMGDVVRLDGGPEPLPLDVNVLTSAHVVVDLIYHPATTPLLVAARERGATAVNGLGMLIHQAAHTFRLWTGEDRRSKPCPRPPSPTSHAAPAAVITDTSTARPLSVVVARPARPRLTLSAGLYERAEHHLGGKRGAARDTGHVRIAGRPAVCSPPRRRQAGCGSTAIVGRAASGFATARSWPPAPNGPSTMHPSKKSMFELLRFEEGLVLLRVDELVPERRAAGGRRGPAPRRRRAAQRVEGTRAGRPVARPPGHPRGQPEVRRGDDRADRWPPLVAIGAGRSVGRWASALHLGELGVTRTVRDLVDLGMWPSRSRARTPSRPARRSTSRRRRRAAWPTAARSSRLSRSARRLAATAAAAPRSPASRSRASSHARSTRRATSRPAAAPSPASAPVSPSARPRPHSTPRAPASWPACRLAPVRRPGVRRPTPAGRRAARPATRSPRRRSAATARRPPWPRCPTPADDPRLPASPQAGEPANGSASRGRHAAARRSAPPPPARPARSTTRPRPRRRPTADGNGRRRRSHGQGSQRRPPPPRPAESADGRPVRPRPRCRSATAARGAPRPRHPRFDTGGRGAAQPPQPVRQRPVRVPGPAARHGPDPAGHRRRRCPPDLHWAADVGRRPTPRGRTVAGPGPGSTPAAADRSQQDRPHVAAMSPEARAAVQGTVGNAGRRHGGPAVAVPTMPTSGPPDGLPVVGPALTADGGRPVTRPRSGHRRRAACSDRGSGHLGQVVVEVAQAGRVTGTAFRAPAGIR